MLWSGVTALTVMSACAAGFDACSFEARRPDEEAASMSIAMSMSDSQPVGLQNPGLLRGQATGHSLCQYSTGAVRSGVTAASQATLACCHMLSLLVHAHCALYPADGASQRLTFFWRPALLSAHALGDSTTSSSLPGDALC